MNNKVHSLYIHIPFCESICDYCDFTKLQYFRFLAIKYLASLKQEIDSYNICPDDIKTIYIGGGTPTVLEDDLFLKLMDLVAPFTKNVLEYTVEANPESLSLDKLQVMKKYHVNRLSIGVESSDDRILKAINRKHTFNDVIKAFNMAREVGFNNINVDLILGLPNASESLLKKDLDNILSLKPEHISCYSLTVNKNTMFYIKGIKERDEDEYRDYYDIVEEELLKHGYLHYEVSNWAKKDRYSLHNLTYWKNEEYYGLGLGASGYVHHVRYTNTKNLDKYFNNEYLCSHEYIDLDSDKDYYIMLSLRTSFGLNLCHYQKLYGKDFYLEHKDTLNGFIKKGLLIKKDKSISPTYEGMMILDTIITDILLD